MSRLLGQPWESSWVEDRYEVGRGYPADCEARPSGARPGRLVGVRRGVHGFRPTFGGHCGRNRFRGRGGRLPAAAPGRGSGKIARITLSPTQPAGPSLLAAAAGVIRLRADVLRLRHTSVTVSDGEDRPHRSRAQPVTAREPRGRRDVGTPTGPCSPRRTPDPSGSADRTGMPGWWTPPTMRLFRRLECKPGASAGTADDSWKAAVGYSPASAPWDELGSQDRLLRHVGHQVRPGQHRGCRHSGDVRDRRHVVRRRAVGRVPVLGHRGVQGLRRPHHPPVRGLRSGRAGWER